MNNEEPKIRFYSIDGSKIEDLKVDSENKINEEKEFKTSSGFNKALKIVIEKDINTLMNKLSRTIKDITKHLVVLSEGKDTINLSDKIEDIDKTITDIDAIISDLIIKKNSIKVGIFSSNKKEKKSNIRKIEDAINFVSKSQNDISSLKDEYNKLIKRNDGLTGFEYEEDEKKEDPPVDPLERTINFYMTKEN